MMDSRLVWVLASGGAIAAVSALRMLYNFPHDFHKQVEQARIVMPAPLFETVDQENRPVMLRSVVGRHDVLLIFFDPELGPSKDPLMQLAIQHRDDLTQNGVRVFAISPRLPQQNRKELGDTPAPFPILSDPSLDISHAWGCARSDNLIVPGIFHINRTGFVNSGGKFPRPVRDPETTIRELAR